MCLFQNAAVLCFIVTDPGGCPSPCAYRFSACRAKQQPLLASVQKNPCSIPLTDPGPKTKWLFSVPLIAWSLSSLSYLSQLLCIDLNQRSTVAYRLGQSRHSLLGISPTFLQRGGRIGCIGPNTNASMAQSAL